MTSRSHQFSLAHPVVWFFFFSVLVAKYLWDYQYMKINWRPEGQTAFKRELWDRGWFLQDKAVKQGNENVPTSKTQALKTTRNRKKKTGIRKILIYAEPEKREKFSHTGTSLFNTRVFTILFMTKVASVVVVKSNKTFPDLQYSSTVL